MTDERMAEIRERRRKALLCRSQQTHDEWRDGMVIDELLDEVDRLKASCEVVRVKTRVLLDIRRLPWPVDRIVQEIYAEVKKV